jgi:hypothetical protein
VAILEVISTDVTDAAPNLMSENVIDETKKLLFSTLPAFVRHGKLSLSD